MALGDVEGRELRTARFAREIQLLSELTHPGIVRYVAHGTTSTGTMFLAMEWLDGEDLGPRLEREPLTIGESVTLVTRVAEALGADSFGDLAEANAIENRFHAIIDGTGDREPIA